MDKIIKIVDDGVVLSIRIAPNSSRNGFVSSEGGLKLKITAQPIENKANKAVVEYLSKLFRVPKTNISILRGECSKDKVILIKTADSTKIEVIKTILLDVVGS